MAHIQTMSGDEPAGPDLIDFLSPLITREIAAIGALSAAIEREDQPDYVSLLHDTRANKQANIEQLSTVIRMTGGVPPERARLRTIIQKAQAIAAERLSGTTALLEAMRLSEFELLEKYSDAYLASRGMPAKALRSALNRTIVHLHIITAHLAKRTDDAREAARLPWPLNRYFAGPRARACMRCHFDRPGKLKPLERTDPHPYTYVCAGCHDEAVADFPPDIAQQMQRWPADVRDTKTIQHALGRGSKLLAAKTILLELSGLKPEPPTPAARQARNLAEFPAPPSPAESTPHTICVDPFSDGEATYVTELFDFRSVRANW